MKLILHRIQQQHHHLIRKYKIQEERIYINFFLKEQTTGIAPILIFDFFVVEQLNKE